MIDKRWESAAAAVADIPDGATIPRGFRMVPKAEQRRWKNIKRKKVK